MRFLFAIVLSLVAGCSTHYHTVTVTSNPSGQMVSVEGVTKGGTPAMLMNSDYRAVPTTPCEFTFYGDVTTATVFLNPVVTLSTDRDNKTKTEMKWDQAKCVSFHHGLSEVRSINDGVIGIPLYSESVYSYQANRRVHFDVAPVGSK